MSNPLTRRKCESSVLLDKNRGNMQSQFVASSKWFYGLSVNQSNSCHCRVLAKQSEYSGRLAIQKLHGFKRLEMESPNIFSNCKNQRNITIVSGLNQDPGSCA